MAIEPEKLELLRVALPKGLAAGDSGLGELRGKPIQQQSSWPQFQSTKTDSRLYTPSPESLDGSVTQQSQQTPTLPHPWKITLKTENGATYYKVDYNSKLYESFSSWNNIAVTGLDFWSEIFSGYAALRADVSNGTCSFAEVASYGDELPDRITFSDSDQTEFVFPIGYFYKDENGNWIVLQKAFMDLTLSSMCINGKPAIYPIC